MISSNAYGFSLLSVLTASALLITACLTLFRFNHRVGVNTARQIETRNALRADAWSLAAGLPLETQPHAVQKQRDDVVYVEVQKDDLTYYVVLPKMTP